MKVAFVGGALAGGGAERTLLWLADACRREGHEAHVVALTARGRDAADAGPGLSVHALDLAGDSAGVWQALRRNVERLRAIRRVLRGIGPDVVVSFLVEVNVLVLLAARGTGTPVIVSERTDPRRHSARRPWPSLRRWLYPRAAAVVVQSEGAAEWARAFCAPARVHVIPNAIATRPAPAGVPAPAWLPGGPFVLGVGRLSAEKGFDLLVRAFARFAPSHPEWSLVLLGEGAERAALESLVAALGLQGRVVLPGFVESPESAYARATCFVLPSRYEGFPNALLEAMRAGLPVASFDCDSGPRDIIHHERDGLLVPPGRVDLLGDAIARLADDIPLRQRLAAAAPGVVERFGEARVFAAWAALMTAASRRQHPAEASDSAVPPGARDV